MPDRPTASALTESLAGALEILVQVVERQSRDFRASVLLLSDDGAHLVHGAAPSLPDDYSRAIDGMEIGETAGSCGTAAFRGERVIVTDIGRDPLWEPFRKLAREHGLEACWSQPIFSADKKVLGTFALYYPEPRSPDRKDLEIIEAAAGHAGSMLERARGGASRDEIVAGMPSRM